MAYYGVGEETTGIEVCVPYAVIVRRTGITVHRRRRLEPHHLRHDVAIRVTNPVLTLVDFAARHDRDEVEQAIGAAELQKVISSLALRAGIDQYRGWPGVRLVRQILERRTFRVTQSRLERLFIPIARRAGVGVPLTQQWVGRYRVDFYWPDLGLVVETDGGDWHASAAQQTIDRRRDQAHVVAGLTPLRFTHFQVRYEPDHVEAVLRTVAERLVRQARLRINA